MWIKSLHSLRDSLLSGETYWSNPSRPGLYLYYYGGYIISYGIGPKYRIIHDDESNTTFWNTYRVFNGQSVYYTNVSQNSPFSVSGTYYLWYDNDQYGWVISKYPGEELKETLDEESGFAGDTWWGGQSNIQSLPNKESPVMFYERGTGRGDVSGEYNGNNFELIFYFPCYIKSDDYSFDGIAGHYVYNDDESIPDLVVGLLVGEETYQDNIIEHIQSLNMESSYYSYGSIYRGDNSWVIGTIDSESGWWESDFSGNPELQDVMNFSFKKPNGSSVTGEDRKVTFSKLITGNQKIERFVCEAPIWF